ncbi:Integrase core domain-containing protein [Microlunatus sagamiharensis]|uniref:Integrase core domain-containing protein n=1 Tax=Microlunatus sagamiharensis TaxID=546874 RepID=A0A1H2LXZ1_9ACTN|nr:IS481 family transposase [Microlunatus sagamiharensis]SDU85873.1 Integrase core domain-containing protein [Microlunatus sagamiharensis]SDU89637.1 Integrase core domain-containing protein [Microlunatus sagamiharensis]SDU98936.1 Integrase core domain-containing protein [Microlunatus sagamiharensis]SDV04612.1 Integrase core domain-containing protein [Microlunatus sagamiharensis]
MAHANARLNRHGRLLLIERVVVQHWPVAHAAKAMGISRQCAYRWVRRWRAEGDAGLLDRSSRPHHSPGQTPAVVEEAITTDRVEYRRGPAWIAARHPVCARTVSRVLVRHQLPRLAVLDPVTGEVIRASKTTAVRYEKDAPGELVHMDVKKIGRIPAGGGWRAHGRLATNSDKHKRALIGYDYVHSVVDDHSRLAYSEVLTDEKGVTCAAFLERALAYLAERGVDRVERLMTDNAFAYRYSLVTVCAEHGIAQKFIKPHCPWQNGKAERYNRTLASEWAYRQVWTSNAARAAALAPWVEHYNTERAHSALDGLTPLARLSPTS